MTINHIMRNGDQKIDQVNQKQLTIRSYYTPFFMKDPEK